MRTTIRSVLLAATLLILSQLAALAHCEIPCGIYDDSARLALIQEHIGTIEKSMGKIRELEQAGGEKNQLVRWIMNKEDHANQLQHIVSQYFMTQRIKPDAEMYAEKISALHRMLIYAMKCKQSTDQAAVDDLKKAAKEFHDLYQHQ